MGSRAAFRGFDRPLVSLNPHKSYLHQVVLAVCVCGCLAVGLWPVRVSPDEVTEPLNINDASVEDPEGQITPSEELPLAR